jgi:3-methyladenine DNA glycosylase/8-oxoguanine DNA glycosylase
VLIRLPYVAPYDWPLALRMIGAHAVPGGERLEADGVAYTRVLTGRRGPLAVTVRQHRDHLSAEVDGAAVPVSDDDAAEVAHRVAHWLDLELEPTPMLTRFGGDPMLGPLVRQRPGLRRIRYPETFEAVVSTVLGQQVSLAAARTFAGRLVAAYGSTAPQGLSAFPQASQVADAPVLELQKAIGITGSRARTVHAVAELFADTGEWPVPLPSAEWDVRAAQLLAVPGIGPWTAAYLQMRLFGDPDAVPVGDLVLRRALGMAKDRDLLAGMQHWRPERTYATFQLWASTAW